MRLRLLVICFSTGLLFSTGCKKDASGDATGITSENNTAIKSSPSVKNNDSENQTNKDETYSTSNEPLILKGTAWQAFINVRVPGDLYNYFIRYAEYHFEDARMEFFANMVNATQYNPYIIREDSVFFNPNNTETFQFKVLERGSYTMKVEAASGKQTTFKRLSEPDLKLTRKERIQKYLEETNLFDKKQIDTQFESIKDIKIN